MKVIYESYRRHRNNSNNSNKNNNNNNSKNGLNHLEICHPNDFQQNSNNESSRMESDQHVNNCRHIISIDSLVINKELGVGEFGVVQQGVWTNPDGQRIQVAIKCLSSARLENSRIEFLKEATIMHSISHEHIVTLYGVVLEPSFMLITELAPLRSLLECLKEPALISHFPLTSLCTFAAQIADGMAYLESKRLIHRDLAARNILVFSKTKVKISDFGLSRALGVGKDYYQSNFNVNLKLPIAWCAPECINYLKFTSQSDVWAYGVTLWEMFSFGFQPWAALTGQQILEAIDKPNYQRLENPECCPKEYYQLMLKCWTHEPNLRPKFSDIVSLLPDCRPELLQAIRSCENVIRKDFLTYKSGDIVTVIDKNYEFIDGTKETYWKGVTNDRKSGLFDPSDFVAYLGQNLPSSNQSSNYSSNSFVQSLLSGSNSNGNHPSSLASAITSTVLQSKFFRGFLESKNFQNNDHSPHGNRKHRLRPEMISRPQGDFKHTGHVGADGVFFGDVSFLEGKYQPVGTKNEELKNKKLTISGPIQNFDRNSFNSVNEKVHYSNSNHEYHEISDEDDIDALESPPFEVLDFGPSLMEEVFKELDHIKPDLDNEAAESETAINENSINVKNEVRELNLKISKETNNLKKKQSIVKPTSEAEEFELDSAIAMTKEIANRTVLEDDLDLTKNDSPKTPNSPNKKKFSFKFPTHRSPKSERKTFSEGTQSIGNIIESITPAAKEAYMSLVEKGINCGPSNKKDTIELDPPSPTTISGSSYNANLSPNSNLSNEIENNPLRMLRTAGIGKVLRPKVRGNRSFSQPRLPTTAQTAGLARVASSRSPLGLPSTMNNCEDQSLSLTTNNQASVNVANINNALPLPPRDRSRPLIQLKTHQRRHPLVIPAELSSTMNNASLNGHLAKNTLEGLDEDPPTSNNLKYHQNSPPLVHRHVPVLKQVLCPQAPAAFLNSVYNNNKIVNMNAINSKPNTSTESDKLTAPMPPPKPNRTYLSDDLTESLENEIQKAFDNIKLNQYSNSVSDSSGNETTHFRKEDSVINVDHKPLAKNQPEIITEKIILNYDNSNPLIINPGPSSQPAANKHDFMEPVPGLVHTSNKHRNINSDEVRVMQKVLSNEMNLTAQECANILDSTDWDIHKAIKCIRLRQQLRIHNINVDCNWSQMLSKFNWNLRQASNYLIATQGVPEDTTEV